VLYSGASLNDVYLHQLDKYRYDRYHLIRNPQMADIMFNWVDKNWFMAVALIVLTIPSVLKARKSKTMFALPPGAA
jgi:phosphatidylserine/phosphatidylglycerophosphate/cardiolipin synthase-like enzyme